jgi:hypothetical protein
MGSGPTKPYYNSPNGGTQHNQIKEEAYGSASQAILRKFEPTHNRGVKLALGLFVICRSKNALCEANIPTLAEIRELNNVKTTIRIIANPKHPMRPLSIDPNITDEYAYRVTTQKPLHVRAAEIFGKLQIDPRRIEQTPPHHRFRTMQHRTWCQWRTVPPGNGSHPE